MAIPNMRGPNGVRGRATSQLWHHAIVSATTSIRCAEYSTFPRWLRHASIPSAELAVQESSPVLGWI